MSNETAVKLSEIYKKLERIEKCVKRLNRIAFDCQTKIRLMKSYKKRKSDLNLSKVWLEAKFDKQFESELKRPEPCQVHDQKVPEPEQWQVHDQQAPVPLMGTKKPDNTQWVLSFFGTDRLRYWLLDPNNGILEYYKDAQCSILAGKVTITAKDDVWINHDEGHVKITQPDTGRIWDLRMNTTNEALTLANSVQMMVLSKNIRP
jgi:hypothetical protein